MLGIFKSLFGKKKETEYIPDPPGRTFNRVLTGKYFACENVDADEHRITESKQKKIAQIAELELIPMFIKYSYEDRSYRRTQGREDHPVPEISSVYVVFQKEVSAQRGQMTHVTEISFIVNYPDFNEFEKMSGVSLSDDFRDLTSYNTAPFNGKERRNKRREEE